MSGDELIKRAYLAILQNDFEQAIALFEQAVMLEPFNASYHYRLSFTCARSNKLEKALEHASIAVRLEPESDEYRFHAQHIEARELLVRAEPLFQMGEKGLTMAVALLKRAVRLDPLLPVAYVMLTHAHLQLHEYAEAALALQEALRLDPENRETRELQAQVNMHLRQWMQSSI